MNIDNSHPVENASYLISTPAISEAICTLSIWLKNRFPGGMITAQPRMGKTCFINYCVSELASIFPNIPIGVVDTSAYRQPSEKSFLIEVLSELGHSIININSPEAGRRRLLNKIEADADKSGSKRYILFMDEAQNLHEHHLRVLMGIHNKLKRRGINLIIILVGQPQLLSIKSAYLATEKKDLVARFMSHHINFSGIISIKELKECIQSFDTESEYPAGSKISYTAAYFPSAFGNGWRLEGCSNLLWDAFIQARKKIIGKVPSEIPMENFCRSIEFILRQGDSLDSKRPDLPKELFEEAVRQSGYVSSLTADISR